MKRGVFALGRLSRVSKHFGTGRLKKAGFRSFRPYGLKEMNDSKAGCMRCMQRIRKRVPYPAYARKVVDFVRARTFDQFATANRIDEVQRFNLKLRMTQ